MVAFLYRPVRELVSDEPHECHNGHGYAGRSVTTPMRDWWPCRCGGHLVIRCRMCPEWRWSRRSGRTATWVTTRRQRLVSLADQRPQRAPGR